MGFGWLIQINSTLCFEVAYEPFAQLRPETSVPKPTSLISEVLREGDSGVDGGLPGGHGHVGRVGHEGRPLHDRRRLPANLNRQLGEVSQYLGLVSKVAYANLI